MVVIVAHTTAISNPVSFDAEEHNKSARQERAEAFEAEGGEAPSRSLPAANAACSESVEADCGRGWRRGAPGSRATPLSPHPKVRTGVTV